MLSRYLNGSTGLGRLVEGELTLENITLDGLCMYTPQTRSTSAFVRVDEGGTLNVKAGTVVRNHAWLLAGLCVVVQPCRQDEHGQR